MFANYGASSENIRRTNPIPPKRERWAMRSRKTKSGRYTLRRIHLRSIALGGYD